MSNVLRGTLVNPEKIYGKSAYEIAVMHGFNGTEEEWLDSLVNDVEVRAAQAIEDADERIGQMNAVVENAQVNVQATSQNAISNVEATSQNAINHIASLAEGAYDIVQTTGDSETKVMSQKAVTDGLKQAEAASLKHAHLLSKDITNLVDIAVGDVLNGRYYNPANGAIVVNDAVATSAFIPVESGKTYKWSGFWWLTALFDKDKNFVRAFDTFSSAMTALKNGIENVAYVRSTLEKENLSSARVWLADDGKYSLTVGIGEKFETIMSAINAVDYDTKERPVTIRVKAGVYNESLSLIGRYIILLGEGRENTIVTNDTGDYDTPPLNIWTGSEVHNMSFIAKPNAKGECTAYGIHYDQTWEYNNRVQNGYSVTRFEGVCVIENCYIASNYSAIGAGVCPNSTLVIRNCELESLGSNFGTLFLHNYLYTGENAKAIVENCVIRNVGGISPMSLVDSNHIDERGTKDNYDTVFCFRNNIAYNEEDGLNATTDGTPPQSGCIAGYIKKDISNYGNNISALNA